MRKNYKRLKAIIILIALMVQMLTSNIQVNASDVDKLAIKEFSVNQGTADPGEQVYFSVSYATQSINYALQNVKLKLEFPKNLAYDIVKESKHVPSGGVTVTGDSSSDDGTTITISLVNKDTDKLVGASGSLNIYAHIENGSIPTGTPFQVTLTPIVNGAEGEKKTATVNAGPSQNYFQLSKVKKNPSSNPTVDQWVTYEISLYENINYSTPGRLDLKNVVLTDVLPDYAELDESSIQTFGASATAQTPTVTTNGAHKEIEWNIGDVNIKKKSSDTYPRMQYKVRYNSDSDPATSFKAGDNPENTVKVKTADDPFGNPVSISDVTFTTSLEDPQPFTEGDISVVKGIKYIYRNNGQEQIYTLKGFVNTGNISLEDVMIKDEDLPDTLTYTSITLPTFKLSGETANVEYYVKYMATADTDWKEHALKTSGSSAETILVSTITSDQLKAIAIQLKDPMPPGMDIGDMEIRGTVKAGVAAETDISNTSKIGFRYKSKLIDPSKPDTDYTIIDKPSNTVTFTVKAPKAWINPSKSIISEKQDGYDPEDTLTFKLVVSNLSSATGNYNNPIIYDYLPDKFNYVDGSFTVTPADPTIKFSKTDKDGRELLKWYWDGAKAIQPGESITIQYNAKIHEETPPSKGGVTYTNTLYITEKDTTGFWWGGGTGNPNWDSVKDSIKDSNNFDGDSGKEEYLVKAEKKILVNEVVTAKVEKWDKGILDSAYKMYDPALENSNSANTISGGTVDYKLVIENEGNGNFEQVEVLDIMPYKGDTAIMTNEARDSQWRPNLLKPLYPYDPTKEYMDYDDGNVTGTVKVFYSTTNDKNLLKKSTNGQVKEFPEVYQDSGKYILNPNYWSPKPPEDITSVRAIFILIQNIKSKRTVSGSDSWVTGLDPKKQITLNWEMRAPVNAVNDIDAWNSIAAQYKTIHGTVLPAAEPIKVGFRLKADSKGQIGNFVWFDSNGDGIQNDGYSDKGVNDSQDNQYAGINGVKVKLWMKDTSNLSNPFTLKDETLTADDANGAPGYYLFPHLEAINRLYYVEYELPSEYTITTPGTLDTNSIVVGDSDGYNDGGTIRTKDITLTFEDPIQSIGTSKYQRHDFDLGLVAASNTASMKTTKVAHSVKAVNGTSLSVNPQTEPVNVGETITYKMSVQNDGTVPLHNVKLQDVMDKNQNGFVFTKIGFDESALQAINDSILVVGKNNSGASPYLIVSQIDVGQTLYLEGTYKVTNNDVDTTSLDNTLQVWSNETHYDASKDPEEAKETVDIAKISINKSANKTEVAPNSALTEKNTVEYTITVANHSNIELQNIIVTDTKIDTFTNLDSEATLVAEGSNVKITALAPGTSIDIKGTYRSQVSDLGNKIRNTAEATHNDIRYTVTDFCDVDTLGLTIIKTETSTTSPYEVGEPVTYNIKVTNTGSKTLNNIQVNDVFYNRAEGASSGHSVAYTIPTLASGTFDDHAVNYTLTDADRVALNKKPLKNIATTQIPGIDEDITSEVTVPTLGVTFVKTGSKQVDKLLEVGDKIDYTFTITNLCSTTLTNIKLNDSKLGIVNQPVDAISPGETKTVTHTYTVKGTDFPGPIENMANITYDGGNNDSNKHYIGDPKIDIQKNVIHGHNKVSYITNNHDKVLQSDFVSGSYDQEITFVFTVKNVGDTYLKNIRIVDNILKIDQDDLTLIPALSSSATFDSSTNIAGNNTNDQLVFYYETKIKNSVVNEATVTGKSSLSNGSDMPGGGEATDKDKATTSIPNSLANIGDKVWLDIDHDGKQDTNEKGISGVKLDLLDSNNNFVKETTTDHTGWYEFKDLSDGVYSVVVNKTTLDEKGYTETYDLDGNLDGRATVTLKDGYSIYDVDFGYSYSGLIGDTVWYDLDRNVKVNGSEQGIPNVKILLKDSMGHVLSSTTTDSKGNYLFDYLQQGNYTVELDSSTLPDDVYLVSEKDGSLDGNYTITLGAGEKNYHIDFGYIVGAPNIMIDKTGDKGTSKAGDSVTYSIKVTNVGTVPLTNVIVSDSVIGINETLAVLDVNETKTFTGTYTITDQDETNGKIVNTATVISNETEQKEDKWTVLVTKEPVIEKEKEIDDTTTVKPKDDIKPKEVIEQPKHGTVEIDDDGNVIYTPEEGYTGKDKFKIKVINDDGEEVIMEIEIDDGEIPLGQFDNEELPKTGQTLPSPYLPLGFSMIAFGLYLGLKKEKVKIKKSL